MENRFSGEQFISELEQQGIEVDGHWVTRGKGDFIFGVGYIFNLNFDLNVLYRPLNFKSI